MTRVLVTAEAFGFGPASKLHAVCAELAGRGAECHLVGEKSALTFARANAATFTSITEVGSMAELAAVAPGGFDAAISVMDPFLPLWARINDVPCLYVDSLYWFWSWSPEREADLRRTAGHLVTTGGLEAMRSITLHDSQYIAHHLSDLTCAQRAPKVAPRLGLLRGLPNVTPVDAIVDLSHRAHAPRTGWLATTSGIVNPLVPVESALAWVEVVGVLLDEAAQVHGAGEPIVLAGNPAVLARARVPGRIEPAPMEHGAILKSMNAALACLAPPGLTTALECAAYGTPLVFLPEQHYGHLTNYREIAQCAAAGAFPHALVDPGGRVSPTGDILAQTLAIAERLRGHARRRDEVWTRMVNGLAEGMRRASREPLHAAQDAAMRRFCGGYGGAGQVVGALESLLSSAPRRRVTL
ncbi:hypothetical protein [Nonomuraea sp. SBT364]|uniref:hypothetical protein n=1 Tax=Nonomuraea sp. SBT364 TaxID=1580530 RepID=UPI00066DD720|nr:hypothetical protein [Nonomuraea sp. SBT364]